MAMTTIIMRQAVMAAFKFKDAQDSWGNDGRRNYQYSGDS